MGRKRLTAEQKAARALERHRKRYATSAEYRRQIKLKKLRRRGLLKLTPLQMKARDATRKRLRYANDPAYRERTRQRTKAWAKANPNKIRESSRKFARKWYEANYDKVATASREWRRRNPTEAYATSIKWRTENREHVNAMARARYNENKGANRERNNEKSRRHYYKKKRQTTNGPTNENVYQVAA